MIEREVRVIDIVKGRAVVRTDRLLLCKDCNIQLIPEENIFEIEIDDSQGVKVGDYIRVGMSGKRLILSSLILYVIPVMFGLLGILLGIILHPLLKVGLDTLCIVFAFSFLLLSYIPIKLLDRWAGLKRGFVPQSMKRVILKKALLKSA